MSGQQIDDAEATSPTIGKLKIEAAELELRSKIAEYRKTLASMDLSAVKAPEGNIAVDGDSAIEGVILGYRAVTKIAEAISKRIRGSTSVPSRIFLYNQADFTARAALQAFHLKIELLDDELAAAIAQGEAFLDQIGGAESATALAIAGTILSSALQVASLFRVDQTLKHVSIAMEDKAVAVAVLAALNASDNAKKIEIYDTATIPISDPVSVGVRLGIGEKLKALSERQTRLIVQRHRLSACREQIAPPESDNAQQTSTDASQASVTSAPVADALVLVDQALANFDAFQATLLKHDDAAGTSLLAQMLAAENLSNLMDDGACFLWLKLAAAGGGWRTTKHIMSSAISYSGGAVVMFVLYDSKGKIIDAATLPYYSGYINEPESSLRHDLLNYGIID